MMPFLWSDWGGSQLIAIVLGLSALTVSLAGVPGTTSIYVCRLREGKKEREGEERTHETEAVATKL